MKYIINLFTIFLVFQARVSVAQGYRKSPRLSEYQFTINLRYQNALGKEKTTVCYLWIPEKCKQVKGIVVLSQNVLEQWLAEHNLVRKACKRSDLAILWTCPGFFTDGKTHFPEENALIVERVLDSLSNISGYDELKHVPWLPIGHSGTNNMVRALLEARPKKIIAAITLKGGPGFMSDPTIPVMCTAGEYFEWNQNKEDLINPIKTVPNYQSVVKERMEKKQPLSYFFDPNTGHFDCSEKLTRAVAHYIESAVKWRVGILKSGLKNTDLSMGWLTGLPLPGAISMRPKPFAAAGLKEINTPWYFTRQQAKQAYRMASVDFNRKPQIAGFANIDGTLAGFKQGIVWPIPFETGKDGVSFKLKPVFFSAIPDTFKNAGMPLGHGRRKPETVLLCGNVKKDKNHGFKIFPGRSLNAGATYFIIRQEGDRKYRTSIQPGQLVVKPNDMGLSQHITFDTISDISKSVKKIYLNATSTSGMPVDFYVKAGPASIVGNQILINPIPIRTKFPVKITVVAYQWGRRLEPAIQTAPSVERSFYIIR